MQSSRRVPTIVAVLLLSVLTATAQPPSRHQRQPFTTQEPMVHDPVMAYEDGTYYLLSTGHGLQWATSTDRRTWTVQPGPFLDSIPQWTRDSVPGFRSHVWAPDVIRKGGRWWLAYSCSTFGRNTSAIGLMTSEKLSGPWHDEGPIVCSQDKRDNWNAIDPCFVVDDEGAAWLAWGSFWDGIQLARLDSAMHLCTAPRTIARRYDRHHESTEPNPTSKFAGPNAIEAPFVFRHGGYYYLFVSWDYCCRGAKSNYRVAVGRSTSVEGPYLDREGRSMLEGGGTLLLEGDKQRYDAAGHCAAYHLYTGEDVFICHGYSTERDGMALLIQKTISWTPDGWPELGDQKE